VRRGGRIGIAIGVAVGITGCKRTTVEVAGDAAAPVAVVDAAVAAPRCKAEGASRRIPGGSLEIGEASRTDDRVAVGVARDLDGKRIGTIASLAVSGDGIGEVELIDVGPLPPDAPAPKAFAGRGQLLSLTHVAKAGKGRGIVASLLAGGKVVQKWAFGDESDDAFSVDAAYLDSSSGVAAFVVWDEVLAKHGVIKLLALNLPTLTGIAEPKESVLSPFASDADSPRISLRPSGGYWAAWIAHKAEDVGAKDAAPEPEGPGEARSLAWIEVLQLDASGTPVGAARRLTAGGKHVQAFDMQAREGVVDLALLDDEEPSDNAGSRLVLLTLRGSDEPTKRVLVPEGVGHGVPDLMAPWVAFTDRQDRTRLVPLAEAGRQSLEPALEGARPLVALASGILAGFPSDPSRSLRALPCRPLP
jgi:hypothetical protein